MALMPGCCCEPTTRCTHRKIDRSGSPIIDWSRGMMPGKFMDSVRDVAADDECNVYVGGMHVGPVHRGILQKWTAAGVKEWSISIDPEIERVATDGEFVWAGTLQTLNPTGPSDLVDTLYMFEAATGALVWSVQAVHYPGVNDIQPLADGRVAVCGAQGFAYGDDGFPNLDRCGYVSIYSNTGTVETVFGGGVTDGLSAVAYALDIDDVGNFYVASNIWRAAREDWENPSMGRCTAFRCASLGNVAKYDSSYEMVWHVRRNMVDRASAIRVVGNDLFVGYTASSGEESTYNPAHIEKWEADTSIRVWGKQLHLGQPQVVSIDANETVVWLVDGIGQFVYEMDYSGTKTWCQKNYGLSGALTRYNAVVACGPDHIYVGGETAKCEIPATSTCDVELDGECGSRLCECVPGTVGPFGWIYSLACPCEEIPCIIPRTFTGAACFAGYTTPYFWVWQPETNTWTATIAIPCGSASYVLSLTATEADAVVCEDRWIVTYSVQLIPGVGALGCPSTATGLAEVVTCWCVDEDHEYPWFEWSVMIPMPGCECCAEGEGGGGDPGDTESSQSSASSASSASSNSSSSPSSPSSASSDSSSSSVQIATACCTGSVESNLVATFSGCLSGSIPLTYISGTTWRSGLLPGCDLYIELGCVPPFNEWRLQLFGACGAGSQFLPGGGACSPLMLVFPTITPVGSCACCTSGTYTVTISE